MRNILVNKIIIAAALVLGTILGASQVMAQSDPFGAVDLVSVDSAQAAPGQTVTVGINVLNDEALSSYTVPFYYDTTILKLNSVSFENSRSSHIGNKIVTPNDFTKINGHFLVTVLKVYEDPIPVGDGPLFFVNFTVKENAAVGASALLDTLFYPPGGSLLLADDSLNQGIVPLFESGMVVVRERNRQPEIQPLTDQYVLEGDSLVVNVSTTDPDGDDLSLVLTSKPTGAQFVDNGDGTGKFIWKPEYVGPYSADGSPYTISFWVTDGDLSSESSMEVEVINRNRRPVITLPETLTIDAGDPIQFGVSAVDPDFETVSWQVNDLPSGASFNNANPGTIAWNSTVSDSGLFAIEVVATDPHGYADTGIVSLNVRAATVYSLTLDTVRAYPNESISFDVTLDNQLPISSFNLLINYDPSALALLEVTKISTRSEGFEYFNVTPNANGAIGDVRIIGIVDQSGVETLPLGAGSIVRFRFLVSADLAYVGMDLPVKFRFLDGFTKNDNTMTDADGIKIEQVQIAYANGVVRVRDYGQIKLGDINLNGLAYEISDAIYFSNYFMNPLLYSFDPLQFANSDVNHDNIAATVADLVTLINIVVNGTPAHRLVSEENPTAGVTVRSEGNDLVLAYDSDLPLGGLTVRLAPGSDFGLTSLDFPQEQMIYDYRQDANELRVLVYSMDNQSMPAGSHDFLRISDNNSFTIENIDLSTAGGQLVAVQLGSPVNLLPDQFVLHQNYPNPFNPETKISFELPSATNVSLDVYNVLGQRVVNLIEATLPAGSHTVTWKGQDEAGNKVASGIYLYRLTTATDVETKKMILTK
jgi:hypothetical protein